MESVKVIIDIEQFNNLVQFKESVLQGKKLFATLDHKEGFIIDPDKALDAVQDYLADLEATITAIKETQVAKTALLKKMTVWQFRKWRKQP